MAKPRTPEPHGPTNPDVKFERTDIEPGVILFYGLTFAAVVAGAVGFILLIAPGVLRGLEPWKRTDLPPMAAATPTGEVGPRLEAIEDLEKKTPRLLPPRAAESQSAALPKGAVPIDEAMAAVVQRVPAGKSPPVGGFGRPLPTGSSAGRVTTGGR